MKYLSCLIPASINICDQEYFLLNNNLYSRQNLSDNFISFSHKTEILCSMIRLLPTLLDMELLLSWKRFCKHLYARDNIFSWLPSWQSIAPSEKIFCWSCSAFGTLLKGFIFPFLLVNVEVRKSKDSITFTNKEG